ncbi:MAG: acetylornithine/N-succinyldiaminopimelate aminotransferase [Candidatus Binatota bacterium]|nr:acetylornithine/N-succinyldiaminopimelate aminotransferase [Candidatus Binatota bacterium]
MTNADILALSDATQLGVYARYPVAFVRGEGARVWDADGKEYLDFFCGLAVTNLGHHHPGVTAAIHAQVDRVLHTSNVYYNEPAARLGQLLTERSFADRVFFSNSGAEANEAAIKCVRRYGANVLGGRYEILTAFGSFHGRTMATLSATAQEKHQAGFQPMLQGFRYVPFGDLEAMRAAVRPETVAILVEPIQGEGGVHVPPDGYLRGLRDLCDERDLLLMLDEVQTGIGRTGRLFAYEHDGIAPDVMTLAKALGGGLPIGAMLATDRVAAALTRGTHGSTFGGNPVSCAAGVAVLEALGAEGLLDHCRRQGERVRERLEALRRRLPLIRDVRGRGLIWGIEIDREARPLVAAALERGLVINVTAERVVRLLPPLTIAAEEIDRGLDVVEDLFESAARGGA